MFSRKDALFIAALATLLFLQGCVSQREINQIAHVDTNVLGLTIYDHYLFAAGAGMEIYDISDPLHIRFVSRTESLHKRSRQVAIRDHFAFVASADDGLELYDIADLEQPVLLTRRSYKWAQGVIVQGDAAFVVDCKIETNLSDNKCGLHILDIKNPLQIVEFSFIPLLGAHDARPPIVVRGNLLYGFRQEGDLGQVLQVWNIANLASPQLLYTLSGYNIDPTDLKIIGDRGYITALGVGLILLDLSDPQKPIVVRDFSNTVRNYFANAHSVDVIGRYAYITDLFYIKAVDLSFLWWPKIDALNRMDQAREVLGYNNYLFVADGAGLFVFKALEE